MAKKGFKDTNPALQFISPPTHNTHNTQEAPSAEERKTKRLNLLLRPSVLADLTKIARMKETSVNDLINSIVEDYRDREREVIDKYNSVFAKD